MSHNILGEKIRSNSVLVKLSNLTRDDVIGRLSDALFANGMVKNSFRDAVIERENSYSTGLETGNICVAIPHTDREHVLSDGIAIATLEHPVTFIAMGTQDVPLDVRIVIMLALSSDDKQIDTLKEVMDLVQQQSLLEQLVCEDSAESLIATLEHHFYKVT